MPCNHSISPDALMDYAWEEVSTSKKTEVKCPLCFVPWSLDTIMKYGGASLDEMKQMEVGIATNFCMKSEDINECPGCQSYCTRMNPTINSVKCLICSKKNRSDYYFCWYCLQAWKSSYSSSACGNPNCSDSEKLSQLKNCGKVKVGYIDLVIFKLRACPKCGTIIELSSGCKHMECRACKIEFCFICLRKKSHGSWSCGSYNTKCELAPVQTSIPKRTN